MSTAATTAAPTAVAEGSLARTPFAHVLLSIHGKGLTGTLAVWPEDGSRGRYYLEDGRSANPLVLDDAVQLDPGAASW